MIVKTNDEIMDKSTEKCIPLPGIEPGSNSVAGKTRYRLCPRGWSIKHLIQKLCY